VLEYSNIFRGRKSDRVSLDVRVSAEQRDGKERSRDGGRENEERKKERKTERAKNECQ
jgi:hypothetical protein